MFKSIKSLFWVMLFSLNCSNQTYSNIDLDYTIKVPCRIDNNYSDFYWNYNDESYKMKLVCFFRNGNISEIRIRLKDGLSDTVYGYYISFKDVDSSIYFKNNIEEREISGQGEKVYKNRNIISMNDKSGYDCKWKYSYFNDTIFVQKKINGKFDVVSEKYMVNKKGNVVFSANCQIGIYNMYYKYIYQNDTLPLRIDEYMDSIKVYSKEFKYFENTIVASSFSAFEIESIDSVFLDKTGLPFEIKTYTKDYNNGFILYYRAEIHYNSLNKEIFDFIKSRSPSIISKINKYLK